MARFRSFAVALFAYLALAAVMFWPLARDLRSGVPHDVGDPLLNTWILWWNAHNVPLTGAWWNAPAFWPLPDFIALSENLLGLSLVASPLQWLGAGPQFAYNLVLFLSWPLSAIAAHALCWHLTKRHDASFVAGLVFGFSPYRLDQVPHVQVLACWWMPLALLALHRSIEAPSVRRALPWLSLFAGALLVQAFSNGYFLFYFSIVVVLWIAWFAARPGSWRITIAIGVAWAVAGLLVVPALWHYKVVHEYWQLTRPYQEILAFSADLPSFVTAGELVLVWPFRPEHRGEQGLYVGVVAATLLIAGLVSAMTAARSLSNRRSTALYVLLGIGVLFLIAALATFTLGGWVIPLGPFSLTSKRAQRPLTIALACFIIAGAFDDRVRRAFLSRSLLLFYALAALVCFVMCLGPSGQLMGERIIEKPPYWWLMKIPGIDSLRVPTRFLLVGALPFAIAVALAYARLTSRLRSSARLVAAAVCVLLIGVDSWPRTLPMHLPRETYSLPAAARSAAVIELPLGDVVDDEIAAMVRGTSHGRPVVNGYTGQFPAPREMLVKALKERDGSALRALTAFGPLCVVINSDLLLARNSRVMTERLGARLLAVERQWSMYLLDASPPPPEGNGPTVPVSRAISLDASQTGAFAADNDVETFWESLTPQRGGEGLELTLARESPVSGIALTQGTRLSEYPRYLFVETSLDGQTWQPAWEGQTAGLAFIASVRDYRRTRVAIAFAPRSARYVRLRQTGSSRDAYWSVGEVEILR